MAHDESDGRYPNAMKFAICNEIFRDWKIEDVFAFAAKLGYDGVEIAPFTLANSVTEVSPAERHRIREAAARTQIEIAGIHWVLVKPEGLYINHPESSIRIVQRLPSPSFQIILDVKAMCSESKPIPQIIRESWPHFAHFHANDKNLKGPGFGEVDFKPIAAALKEVGYGGFVSVEVFNFDEGAELIATKSLEYLQRTFASSVSEKL